MAKPSASVSSPRSGLNRYMLPIFASSPLRLFAHVHRSEHEASLAIYLSVVQARLHLVLLGMSDQRQGGPVEIEEVQPASQSKHRPCSASKCRRPDRTRQMPCAMLLSMCVASIDSAAQAVDPVQALLAHVPDHTFPENRLAIHELLDSHGAQRTAAL